MGKYQISVKETKEKLKYVKELLKSNLSAEDKEKVQISLFSYLSILNASTNVQLTNFLNQITKGKFSQRGIQECESVAEILVNDYISGFDYVDNHYLEFLIELTNNVAVSDVSDQQFENINISNEQLMQMTRNFYNSFDNKKIKDCFNQVVSKKIPLVLFLDLIFFPEKIVLWVGFVYMIISFINPILLYISIKILKIF